MEASGKERSGADGEIEGNSDTPNTMTGGEHQSCSNKTASRRAATSRHTPRTLGNLQEMLNAGIRHIGIGSDIGRANIMDEVDVVADRPFFSSRLPYLPSPSPVASEL